MTVDRRNQSFCWSELRTFADMTNGLNCSFFNRPVGWCLGSAGHLIIKQKMTLESEDIKKLIQNAQKLFGQDDANEISKNALSSCLRTVRNSDHLPSDTAREIDRLISPTS